MTSEQFHTYSVPYPPYEAGRALQCASVRDFQDYEPLDFRGIYQEQVAADALRTTAQAVADYVLKRRHLDFGESGQVENMDRVSKFLGGLAVRPFGRLSVVKSLNLSSNPDAPALVENPGITISDFRQSFVIEDNIDMAFAEAMASRSSVPEISRSLYIEHVAVHELVHLSGVADIAYFTLVRGSDGHLRFDSRAHGTTLEKKRGNTPRGALFEEGFATLCGHMYLWCNLPGIAEDKRTEPKQSPDGTEVDLPIRHIFAGNANSYAAWAVERLIDYSPQLWDVLIGSRTYGISPDYVRKAIKNKLDPLDKNLFDSIDAVDVGNLADVMETAHSIDCIVKNETGR